MGKELSNKQCFGDNIGENWVDSKNWKRQLRFDCARHNASYLSSCTAWGVCAFEITFDKLKIDFEKLKINFKSFKSFFLKKIILLKLLYLIVNIKKSNEWVIFENIILRVNFTLKVCLRLFSKKSKNNLKKLNVNLMFNIFFSNNFLKST